MNSIFITGATGFIGGHLARRLLAEGAAVRILARNPEKAAPLAALGAQVVEGDITQDPKGCGEDGAEGGGKDSAEDGGRSKPSGSGLAAGMAGCDVVFHCAAWVSESGSPEQAWQTNVEGTRHVVETAVAAGVQRFVHVSSCSVYGSVQVFDIDETTPTRRRGNLYGDSKVAAEDVVFEAYRQHGLPVVVARVSQVYGPGSDQFTIRPVKAIKSGQMVLVDGGRHLCKPIYIDNLIEGLLLCSRVEAAVGEAINLTDGYTVPWRDFFGAYGRMLGVEKFISLPYPLAWLAALWIETQAGWKGKKASITRGAVNSLRSSNSFSNQKARRLLGWEPKIGFEEGMCCSEQWLRAEGYLVGPPLLHHR